MPARSALEAQYKSYYEDVNQITRSLYNYSPSIYHPHPNHPNIRIKDKFMQMVREEEVLDIQLRDKN